MTHITLSAVPVLTRRTGLYGLFRASLLPSAARHLVISHENLTMRGEK